MQPKDLVQDNMWKTKITGISVERKSAHRSKRTLYRLIFALALAMKVTPKQMAKFFDTEKTNKYASDFTKALSEKTK